jgi:spore coat protein U-like protein
MLLSLFLIGFAGTAWSQECKVTVSPLNFGDYDPFSGAPRDATGKINVLCDSGVPFTVKLDKGKSRGGGFPQRHLEASGGRKGLRFNLYRDSARQEMWGDGTGNTFVVTGTGTGRSVSLTVYGRIPARQNVPAELYSDDINVIVEY